MIKTPDTEYYSKLAKEFKTIMKEIKKAKRIIVFRHEVPDFDALGTQMGLVTFLKDNFPSKEVHYVGDKMNCFIPRIFPEPEEDTPEMFAEPYLAIVVDTGNSKRISKFNITKATKVIKLDHHPEVEAYAQISSVHPEMAAASELVTLMIEGCPGGHFYLSPEAARYLFIGMVGDSGRFRFPETSAATLRLAADLLQTGIDKEKIYAEMYLTSKKEFEFKKWALTHYQISEGGTCYYILHDKDLKELGLEMGQGKTQLSLFKDVEGIDVCLSITEDVEKGEYRLSFRSGNKPVSKVAALYGGGGHLFAAGGRLKDLKDLPNLIKALDDLKVVDDAHFE